MTFFIRIARGARLERDAKSHSRAVAVEDRGELRLAFGIIRAGAHEKDHTYRSQDATRDKEARFGVGT